MFARRDFTFFLSLAFFCLSVSLVWSQFSPTASFLGTHTSERVGYHLHSAGDVNHDGYDDLLIGTFHNHANGYNAGAAYLVLGNSQANWGLGKSLNNATARFIGADDYDAVGYCLAGGGDVNGDGYDDMIIGAPAGDDQYPEKPGYVFVVFGKSNPNWGSNFVLLNSADASFHGEVGHDLAGLSVACVGDVNADGYDDFICGAPFNDYGNTDAGKVYLILGKASGWQREVSLSNAAASFTGSSRDGLFGYGIDGLGDVNGDGIPDFGVGERGKGNVYIFFGRSNVNWGLNFSASQADVIIYGDEYQDWAGWRVSRAGDVNNDGLDDILIGAPLNNDGGSDAGKVSLILGRTSGWPSNLADADASFNGKAANDQAGWDVQDAGDWNSDGFDDFLIGAWYNDDNGTDAGKMYLIKGRAQGWQRNVSLSTISDVFAGENAGDYAGFSVCTGGDMNGDGVKDLATSETYNGDAYTWGGKILIFVSEKLTPQLSLSTSALNFGYDLGSLTLTVTNSGTGTLDWNAAKGAQDTWISSISPASGSLTAQASATVTVSVSRSGLADGNYSGSIQFTSNGGDQTVTVAINVGTPPPVISVSPTSLAFTATAGGSDPENQTITVTNSGGGTLAWTATEQPEASWLTLTHTSGGTGETVQVAASVSGLTAGTYQTSVRISDATATNSPVDVPVTFTVGTASSGSVLAHFEAENSSSFPNSGWQKTTNEGASAILAIVSSTSNPNESYRLDYTFTVPSGITTLYVFCEIDVNNSYDNDSFWVTMNGSQKCRWAGMKTLGDGWKREWVYHQGTDTQHAFTVSAGQNKLNLYPRESGGYVNWLVVTTDKNFDITNYQPGGTSPSSPMIAVSPASISFSAITGGSDPSGQTITITNSGSGTLAWTATEQPEASWLTLTHTSGGTGGTVQLAASVSGLAAGTYQTSVRITDANATNSPVDIPVTFTVGTASSGSVLAHFEAENSSSFPNSGWQKTTNEGASCILALVSSTSNPNDSYRLDYTFTVPSGTSTVYVFADVDINNSYDNDSFWVTMNGSQKCKWAGLKILGDGWKRQWVYHQGTDTQHAFTVSAGQNKLNLYPRESGGYVNWLVVTTDKNFDIANYQPGGTSPSSPMIAVSPTSISFSATTGGSDPGNQSITVTNSGNGTLAWTAAEQPEASWLTLTNTSGSTGGTVQVAASISGLAAGTYQTSVRITDANATNSPVDVPVTLSVASAPTGAILAQFEAESSGSLPNSGWQKTTNEGASCLLALQNSSGNPNTAYRLDYAFDVPTGTTKVYVFGEIDVNNNSDNDSFWITMNSSDKCNWNGLKTSGDGWKRRWIFNVNVDTQHGFTVSAGKNVLNVYPRESGAFINWIVITTNPNYDIQSHVFQATLAKFDADSQPFEDQTTIEKPTRLTLKQNYPNPFNSSALICFEIPEESLVKITIYNILGQVVREFVNQNQPAGVGSVRWEGLNEAGEPVQSGIYFCRLIAGHQQQMMKMNLVR